MKPLLFSAAALAAACFLLPGARCLAASPQITGAEAVAEFASDGEHVSRVVLSYDFPIDAASVTPDDYEVTGRTITRAYPVEGQDPASAAPKTGSYVVLELAPLPLVDSSVDTHPEDGPIAQRNAMGHMGPTLGSHGNPQPLPVMEAQVVQVGLVKTTAGLLCAPSASQKRRACANSSSRISSRQYSRIPRRAARHSPTTFTFQRTMTRKNAIRSSSLCTMPVPSRPISKRPSSKDSARSRSPRQSGRQSIPASSSPRSTIPSSSTISTSTGQS